MYVERGMEEIVCLKKEMGLREEEEREFDEFVLLCLRLRGRVFLIGFWFWGEGNFWVFRLLAFFFLAEIFGCFFFLFNNAVFFLVSEKKNFVYIYFFNIVLTWKIVGVSKVSVIYIYIYI